MYIAYDDAESNLRRSVRCLMQIEKTINLPALTHGHGCDTDKCRFLLLETSSVGPIYVAFHYFPSYEKDHYVVTRSIFAHVGANV